MKRFFILCMTFFSLTTAFGQLEPIGYVENGQQLRGYSALPAREIREKAGVLILPAWMGIDDHSKEAALSLAKIGYHAFVADIYGEGKYPKNMEEAGKMAGYYKKNIGEYHNRIKAALEQLIKAGADPNRIVVIGYCFGGTGAIEAARMNMAVKGVVSFHGGLGRDATRAIQTIAPKVLVLHGADDPYVATDEVTEFQQEMRDSKADWQMIYYAGAVHAFSDPYAGSDNSKGAAYNAKAACRSWEHMLVFLKDVLK